MTTNVKDMGLCPCLLLNIIFTPPAVSKQNIKTKTKPNKNNIKTKYCAAFLYLLRITDNLSKNKFYQITFDKHTTIQQNNITIE